MNLITTVKLKYDITDNFIKYNKLSPDVLEYYINNYKVNWMWLSEYQTLSEQFIDKYSDKVNWGAISRRQTLSELFIDKYSDKVVWLYISANRGLSESFIEQYSDRVNWYYISSYQTISEQFIDKYSDRVNWNCISANQTLSESFIEKYVGRINWFELFNNKKTNLSYELSLKYLYAFNLYEASIGKENIEVVDRLIADFPDKYEIDKLAYEFNINNRRI